MTRVGCLAALAMLAAILSGCAEKREWDYSVTSGNAKLYLLCARTEDQRRHGLMNREHLDDDWGMIFIWPDEEPRGFWMKNTKIPLSIAFVDSGLVVRDIQDMEPMSEEVHESPVAVQFAIEVNKGWFARNGIKTGSELKFSPRLDDLVKECVKGAPNGKKR